MSIHIREEDIVNGEIVDFLYQVVYGLIYIL